MRLITLLITVLLTSLIFSSCQKPYDPLDPLPSNGIPEDSSLLQRFVLRDSLVQTGNDTLTILINTYDAQKRMATQQEFGEFTNGIPDYDYLRRFYYHGSDTLPYKITVQGWGFWISPSRQYDILDTAYLTYSSQGKIIRDSVRHRQISTGNFSITVTAFIYSSSTIIRNYGSVDTANQALPLVFHISDTFKVSHLNGNLVRLQEPLNFYGWSSLEDYNLTYDTKINPFLRSQKGFIRDPAQLFEAYPNEFFQPSNPLTFNWRRTENGVLVDDYTNYYKYSFGKNGLPSVVEVESSDIRNPVREFTYMGYYYYTK